MNWISPNESSLVSIFSVLSETSPIQFKCLVVLHILTDVLRWTDDSFRHAESHASSSFGQWQRCDTKSCHNLTLSSDHWWSIFFQVIPNVFNVELIPQGFFKKYIIDSKKRIHPRMTSLHSTTSSRLYRSVSFLRLKSWSLSLDWNDNPPNMNVKFTVNSTFLIRPKRNDRCLVDTIWWTSPVDFKSIGSICRISSPRIRSSVGCRRGARVSSVVRHVRRCSIRWCVGEVNCCSSVALRKENLNRIDNHRWMALSPLSPFRVFHSDLCPF